MLIDGGTRTDRDLGGMVTVYQVPVAAYIVPCVGDEQDQEDEKGTDESALRTYKKGSSITHGQNP